MSSPTLAKRLQQLSEPQRRGAVPDEHAWLSASAGTGKTQVLTARVLRLLLSGIKPEAILCITFTKAGAAEMARRVRDQLASWVQLPEKLLKEDLFAIGAPNQDADVIARARCLFAEVIDAPGPGLAIQTIHSFCQNLLAAFPEEAGLTPGFRALEAGESAQLRRDVLDRMLADAQRGGDNALLGWVEQLALALGEGPTQSWLNRCAAAGEALETLPVTVQPGLRNHFDLPGGTPEAMLVAGLADDQIDLAGWRALADANRAWGKDTGDKRMPVFAEWLGGRAEVRVGCLDAAIETVLTKAGTLRAEYAKGKLSHASDLGQRLIDPLITLRDRAAQMAEIDRMAAALEAGRRFARAVSDAKRAEGLVEFDDLIARVEALLHTAGIAEWIAYKLDARIDHILLDEAQDTNRAQWRIVHKLCEEYFAGLGQKDGRSRTLFVVGDHKQAIYGFQGTDPEYFNLSRRRYALLAEQAAQAFNDVAIDTNFRSSPPILAAIDKVVSALGSEAFGLDPDTRVSHLAHATTAPGTVALWPLQSADAAASDDDDGDEDAATDGGEGDISWIDPGRLDVATKIARTVRRWLDHGIGNEPVLPGDIMILLRSRGEMAAQIVASLQVQGVPVAGVDRLSLQLPIAIRDLIAAARFALQPLDDLNLASLLVSPLIGWSHDELVDRAWRPRDGEGRLVPLWPHLRTEDATRGLLDPLFALLNMAGNVTPYRFFETILSGPMQGRAKLLARLGNAARDPVEELLSQALAFETREGASLHQFLRWFDSNDQDIQRELDTASAAVRVMTAHGAKGLQARIVILADAADDPQRARRSAADGPKWSFGDDGVPIPLLRKTKGAVWPTEWQDAQDSADRTEMQEYRRLLYVAMTRAERMLFVTGRLAKGKEAAPEASWYHAIAGAMPLLDAKPMRDPVWGSATVYHVAGKEDRKRGDTGLEPVASIPDWALHAPAEEPRPPRPLAPSTLVEAADLSVPQPPLSSARMAAAERGTLLHALFERLPGAAPDRRRDAALTWLMRQSPALSDDARTAMTDDVLAVISDPAHAVLFGPDALAEVPFSALVDGRVIAGTVDRLLVTDDVVRVIDFKTGTTVPATIDAVPVGYLRQMAAYAAALAVVFPGRRVEAALLFTAGPVMIELPADTLILHAPSLAPTPSISA
jgi:ATP-dependent helicase/nuclease subunit A